MHVPWGWIKQRPHFLAEELSKSYEIEVFYRKALRINKSDLKEKHTNSFKIREFISIPFSRLPFVKHLSFLEVINKLLISKILLRLHSAEIVWIPSISIYKLLRSHIKPNQKIIYDCMDDEFEFGDDRNSKDYKEKRNLEKELVYRASLNFCSASHLAEVVSKRTGYTLNDIKIINNAIETPRVERVDIPQEIEELLDRVKSLPNPILYVGTIAKWFDFELIKKTLEANKNLNFMLIGPSYVDIPKIEGLHHIGTVERKYIFHFMEIAKALVMPFNVTPLIESVNPVKLYEYIYTSKPVIAPLYGESLNFRPFVNLYSSDDEFIELCNKSIQDGNKMIESKDKQKDFISNNTWTARAKEIISCINRELL